MFINESAANERTGNRRYGWAPIGQQATAISLLARSERYSILPAYTIDRYIATAIHKGSITRDIYFTFIQNEVLPHCNPWPAPRLVLVMDNASIHHNPKFRAMVAAAGVILEYLPLYSLDFNPIELSFHKLKAWIRRNRQLINDFDDFGLFLKFAVDSCSSWKQAIGHFRRCFVDVTGHD